MEEKAIILFDGICNLCNGAVQFIIKHDPKAYFKFSALQSEFSKDYFQKHRKNEERMGSLILLEHGKVYHQSTAVLKIVRHLSGGWKFFACFLVVPRFIRDWVYEIIAKNRYQWFGRREKCMVPEPGVQDRFL